MGRRHSGVTGTVSPRPLVVAGCAVDQLPDDVDVPGVAGCLLDHVDEHPPHRHHGVAEPRCPGGVEVDVGDDLIGRDPGPTIEHNDVIGGLVRLDPQVSVLVVFIERERARSPARRSGRTSRTRRTRGV
jgi:hypothetical protein